MIFMENYFLHFSHHHGLWCTYFYCQNTFYLPTINFFGFFSKGHCCLFDFRQGLVSLPFLSLQKVLITSSGCLLRMMLVQVSQQLLKNQSQQRTHSVSFNVKITNQSGVGISADNSTRSCILRWLQINVYLHYSLVKTLKLKLLNI